MEHKQITNFVERVRLLPQFYGLNIDADLLEFNKNLHNHKIETNSTTIVLIPHQLQCIFCQNVTLITQPSRFQKNPIIYTRSRIGKLYYNVILTEKFIKQLFNL